MRQLNPNHPLFTFHPWEFTAGIVATEFLRKLEENDPSKNGLRVIANATSFMFFMNRQYWGLGSIKAATLAALPPTEREAIEWFQTIFAATSLPLPTGYQEFLRQ
jgi:hypothetical protein